MADTRSILVASGLDPSGGAGFLADARLVDRAGYRPVGAVTAETVQDTRAVRRVEPAAAELLEAQLTALLSDVEVAAGKIGLVPDLEVAEALARALALTAAPVVWDPVLTATSGAAMASADPWDLAARLAPEVALITPNLAEAAALLGRRLVDVAAVRAAASDLAGRLGCAVLIKGGHLSGEPIDVLAEGKDVTEIAGERVPGPPVHGTGCFLSASIACELAGGASLLDAARSAKEALAERLKAPERPGRGSAAVL